jgi:hypothetical protein
MRCVIILLGTAALASAFHDCIQPAKGHRLPPGMAHLYPPADPPAGCNGGLCVGMHGGPHESGPSSYPVGTSDTGFTTVVSTMTVPQLPEKQDGICYYIWTDIFFGDMSYGRMNQFVPQLILGNALDGSSGAPDYKPKWGLHKTWSFGAHYFFGTNSFRYLHCLDSNSLQLNCCCRDVQRYDQQHPEPCRLWRPLRGARW